MNLGRIATASREFCQVTLDALPEHLCVVDEKGAILFVNNAWRRFADENPPAPDNYCIGHNYFDACDRAEGKDADAAMLFARGLRDVLGGTRPLFELQYTCHAPEEERWFVGRASSLAADSTARAVITHTDITKQHRVNEALLESEELYRVTLSNISDAVMLTDDDNRFVLICTNVERTFGWSTDEVYAMGHMRALVGPGPIIPSALHQEMNEVEWTIASKSGRLRNLLVQIKPVRIGRATRLFTCHDITERKLAELELKEAELRYRTLFENSGTGIVLIGRDGIYQTVNQRGAHVMGSLPEQIVGKSIADFFDPVTAQTYLAQNQAIIDSGMGKDYETTFLLGGQLRTFLMSDRCLKDVNGRGVALQSSCIEITDRKHVEDALRVNESMFRGIFEYSSIGLSITSLDHTMRVNKSFCAMLGFTEEEIAACSWKDITHPDDFVIHQKTFNQMTGGQVESSRTTLRFVHKSGSIVWGDVNSILLRDQLNKPLYFFNAILDITQWHSAQEELHSLAGHLQSAREEERRFIAREIHDRFGQVLSALKIDLGLMMKEIRRDAGDGIHDRLIKQLGSFDETIESVVIELRHLVTHLRPEILEAIGIVAAMDNEVREFGRASGLSVRFSTNIGDLSIGPKVSITLYRILQESLTNIRRHAQAKHVTVTFDKVPDELVLQVADDGRGLPVPPTSHIVPYGILGMKERALLLKGNFSIDRSPAGETIVSVRIPWPAITEGAYR